MAVPCRGASKAGCGPARGGSSIPCSEVQCCQLPPKKVGHHVTVYFLYRVEYIYIYIYMFVFFLHCLWSPVFLRLLSAFSQWQCIVEEAARPEVEWPFEAGALFALREVPDFFRGTLMFLRFRLVSSPANLATGLCLLEEPAQMLEWPLEAGPVFL